MGRSGIDGDGDSRGSWGGGGSDDNRGSWGRSSDSGRSGIDHGGGGFDFGGFNFGAPPPPPRRTRHSHHSGSHMYGGRPYIGFGPGVGVGPGGVHLHVGGGGSRGGNLIISIIFIVIFLSIVLFNLSSSSGGSITASTVFREPLPDGSVVETGYYADDAGWISNPAALEKGMKYFYEKTGVQPYVYITEEVDSSRDPSDDQMATFASSLYDKLFTDEAHLLLVFQDADGHYYPWVITGTQAKQVVDGEAVTILFDYIDRYYYDSSLSSEEFFSDVFESTADRIMDKTTNPVFIIGICFCGVVALFIIAVVVSNVLKHKKEEADRMERILNTDLSDQVEASPGLKDLEDKYK